MIIVTTLIRKHIKFFISCYNINKPDACQWGERKRTNDLHDNSQSQVANHRQDHLPSTEPTDQWDTLS